MDDDDTLQRAVVMKQEYRLSSVSPSWKSNQSPILRCRKHVKKSYPMGVSRRNVHRNGSHWARLVAQSTYDLPNDNTACPANCRQVPWKAGSDLWNGGTLPNYVQATCTGLSGNGTTNDGPAIQDCIDSAPAGTAVYVPKGVYYVNSTLSMRSNVALRGALSSAPPYLPAANPSATTFKLGSNGGVSFSGGSTGPNVGIAGGYSKGSTSLVMNAGHGFETGDWIIVSEKPDTAIPVTNSGDDGACTWCGENDVFTDGADRASVANVSGNNITLSRPLYTHSNPDCLRWPGASLLK